MKGLIYKDIQLIFKSVKFTHLVLVAVCLTLLFTRAGVYSGIIATVMFSIAISIQSVMSLSYDELARWRKYELVLPVKRSNIVASKYGAVFICLFFSLISAIMFNTISGLLYGGIQPLFLFASIGAAIIIPLFWSGIILPLAYWLGYQSASWLSIITTIPIFYLVKYFEDGPGTMPAGESLTYLLGAGIAGAVVLFVISYMVSVAIYLKKEYR